jgi:hypothetical protein
LSKAEIHKSELKRPIWVNNLKNSSRVVTEGEYVLIVAQSAGASLMITRFLGPLIARVRDMRVFGPNRSQFGARMVRPASTFLDAMKSEVKRKIVFALTLLFLPAVSIVFAGLSLLFYPEAFSTLMAMFLISGGLFLALMVFSFIFVFKKLQTLRQQFQGKVFIQGLQITPNQHHTGEQSFTDSARESQSQLEQLEDILDEEHLEALILERKKVTFH